MGSSVEQKALADVNRIKLSPDLATGRSLCRAVGCRDNGTPRSCELSVFITAASVDAIVP